MGIEPKKIEVDIDALTVHFIWYDDTEQTLHHQQLREACHCAFCKTKRFTGHSVTLDSHVKITKMYDQGYGVQICFSDGHDKGIYPWQFLKQLNAVH